MFTFKVNKNFGILLLHFVHPYKVTPKTFWGGFGPLQDLCGRHKIHVYMHINNVNENFLEFFSFRFTFPSNRSIMYL